MTKEKYLFKNTFIITVGKICTQLITFFLLPLYTAVLSTEEYGTVDLVTTLSMLLLPIITFQAEQAIFRELLENRTNQKKNNLIISNGIISVTIQCCFFIIIYLLLSPIFKNEYIYLLLINVVCYIYVSLFQQIARGKGNNITYSIGSFINASTTILFNLIFLLKFQMGAKGMILGNIFGQLTAIIYLFISEKILKNLHLSLFNIKYVKKLWKYSFPLIPNELSWWVFNVSDRVIVSLILGLSANGILSAASKFSNVYITLFNIFNISWTESISLFIKEKDIDKFFNHVFGIALSLFSAIGLGIIACLPFVFNIIININYNASYNLIPILVIASMFNVIVGLLSAVYIGNKNTKAVAKTSVISALINLTVHLFLIKFIGLYAAVISTLVSFVIMSIYRLNDINKNYIKIIFNYKKIICTLIVTLIITITYYSNNLYMHILGLMLAFVYAIFINKNIINMLMIKIKKERKKVYYD